MARLTLNSLLEEVGARLVDTRLVRHQDNRGGVERSPYRLWLAQDGSLERYQEIQGERRFAVGQWLASFVVAPLGETIFVGIFHVAGIGDVSPGTLDPVSGQDVTGLVHYNLLRLPALADYVGRLVIDWGPAPRTWIQRADRQDKPIVELRKTAIDPPFPGFSGFRHSVRSLETVPLTWRVALAAVSGVYLLTSRTTGKAYVGSAYGTGGFWARWENYAQTGHGGNEGMRLAPDQDYQVSILEVASSSASVEEVVRMESLWKDKLLSKQFGLNRN